MRFSGVYLLYGRVQYISDIPDRENRKGKPRGIQIGVDREMTLEKKKYFVGLYRIYEAENPEESYRRLVSRFTTWAISEKQAINNIRFRNGGNKSRARISGSRGSLYEDYAICGENDPITEMR